MALVTLHTLAERVKSSLRLSAIVAVTDFGAHPTTRVRERNAVETLETVADDVDSTRERIAIDTEDGRTLVLSATEKFAAVEVTDETRESVADSN